MCAGNIDATAAFSPTKQNTDLMSTAKERITGGEFVFGGCLCCISTCNLPKPTLCCKYDVKCLICDGGFCCAAGDSYPVGIIDDDSAIAKKKLSLFCCDFKLVKPDPKQLCFCTLDCLICKESCDCPAGKAPCACLAYQLTPEKGLAMAPPSDAMVRL